MHEHTALSTSRTRLAGRYWPDPLQRQLLHAVLCRGDAALSAWRHWQARVDVDRVDVGTQRLLPLLAHNLRRQGVADSEIGRFKGLLRHAWAANQRRVAEIAPLIAGFRKAGIHAMVLKGMALIGRYYPNAGLRPMEDVDLLVPVADAPRAMAMLEDLHWTPLGPPVDPTFAHARSFVHRSGCQLDLHWHAQWEYCGAEDAADVWTHAEQSHLGGEPVAVPSGADLLLQVIVHGCRWNSVPPIRWVADAMLIVTSDQPLDWSRLTAQTIRHDLALPVRQALLFLVAEFGAPIPDEVLAVLAAHRPSAFERVEQQMREWTSPAVGCFPLVLCHHVRVTRGEGAIVSAWRLPRYLQHTYQLPSLRALPGALYTRARRRLRAAAVLS